MKAVFKYPIVVIIISLLTNCLKDPCTGVFCSQNGECINGTCYCEENFLGNQCQYSFASYFSGNYGIYDAEVDSIIDTILINNVNNSTDNNISIKNYANLNDDLEILATVQNDSVIDIFEQTATFENEDSIEQEVIVSGSILGKPTDTLMLTSIYTYNNKDSIYNKKLLKLEN